MQNVQSYPWYVQHSPKFVTLYNALFDIVAQASPLGLGDTFDLDKAFGAALRRLGVMWGLQGAPSYYDGLIYKVDNWSQEKVWGGQVRDVDATLYKNFIRMHMYCYGRQYNLQLISDALAILLSDFPYTVTVTEDFMNFTINLTAEPDTLRIIQQLQSYDRHFLGKPSGISYTFNYIPMEQ